MPSTAIRYFRFRPELQELEVTFTTGRRYLYSDVSQAAADGFRAASSKGTYFNRYIRDRYAYRELERQE